MPSSKAPHSIALALLAAASSGLAASTIEEIEVQGRRINLVGDASSASEGVVSQQELELRPLLRTGEIMETIPGMVATQHSGSGKANQYFLRGFNLDHGTDFATSVDGIPVNMRSHGHGQGYTDLSFVIPETIQSISYRKGSYYARNGDFSGAGSAQLATLNKLPGQQVAVAFGEDAYARVLALGQIGLDNSDILYALEHQRYDGPWKDIDEDVDKHNLWLKQVWQGADSRLAITAMAYDNQWNSADQIPERAVRQGLVAELGSLDPTLGGNSQRYSLSLDWARQFGDSQVQASAYAVDYELMLWSNFTYFTAPEGDQFQQVDKRQIYGWDAAWSTQSTLQSLPMQNTIGSSYRYDAVDEVGLYHSKARRVTGTIRTDQVDQWSLGIFWENELHWNDQLRSVFGLRHDYYHFEVDPLLAAEASSLAANGGKESDSITTASLSLIYSLNDTFETYASIGQGFHSNDARGVTARQDPLSGEALSAADPLVDTLGYELGLRAFINDKLNASFALWQLDIDSELIFVGDEGVTEDTGVGSQRHGFELAAYYYLNDYWTVDLEYAFTKARFDEKVAGSRDIPGALESVLSAGLTLQISDSLHAQLRLRHFDDYPLDDGARAAAASLANLGLGYQFANGWEIDLDVLNLFNSSDRDVEYYYESQLAGESEAVADHHYHVFEPRTIRVQGSYHF